MMYKQRDIVLIPIPFTNLSSSKRRPVVNISENEYNRTNPDVIVVAITSNLKYKNQYSIVITDKNLENGSLPLISNIRCDRIYTLSRDIIVKKFFRIDEKTFLQIEKKLNLLFSPST